MIRGYADYVPAETRSKDLENLSQVQSIRPKSPPGNRTPRLHVAPESGRLHGAVLGSDFQAPRNKKQKRLISEETSR